MPQVGISYMRHFCFAALDVFCLFVLSLHMADGNHRSAGTDKPSGENRRPWPSEPGDIWKPGRGLNASVASEGNASGSGKRIRKHRTQ